MDELPPGETPADEGADQLYFQALEQLLARLRGGGLLLSPADWQVAAQWRRRGVPLELVARAMEDLYARRRERDSKRRINSLRYFAPAVEAAWEELRALSGSGHRLAPAPFDAAARLRRLASALPAGIAERDRWVARIEALAGDSASVEESLAAFDDELLSASEERLSAEQRGRIDAGRDAVLSRLALRLPAEEVTVAAGRLRRQELRRELGLPVLSLFSPEAQPAPEEEPGTGDSA